MSTVCFDNSTLSICLSFKQMEKCPQDKNWMLNRLLLNHYGFYTERVTLSCLPYDHYHLHWYNVSWEIDGERVETVSDFIFLGSNITADGDWAMKLKDAYSLEEKLWPT